MAPRIYGLYKAEFLLGKLSEFQKHYSNISKADLLEGKSVGILMEEIQHSWNFLKQDRPWKFRLSPEILNTIRQKLKTLSENLATLRIYEHDLQFVVDDQGNIKIIDVEFADFLFQDEPLPFDPEMYFRVLLRRLNGA